jgi:transposase
MSITTTKLLQLTHRTCTSEPAASRCDLATASNGDVTVTGAPQAVPPASPRGPPAALAGQERFIGFLESLIHDFDTPIFLVVDGSSVHKAKIVKEYVAGTKGRLEMFFLPPYSPELNPDEWVNKNVKHDRLARAVPLTRDELKTIAVEALERLKKCPGIVRGFFGDPKLAYVHA